jgi:hypothetical protein
MIVMVDGAVDLSIDVGERLGIDLDQLTPGALAEIRAIQQELVRSWREELIGSWPVDTGRSQSSWVNRWEGLVWVLRNPVEYAEFVHPPGGDDGGYGQLGDSAAFLEQASEDLLDEVLPALEAIATESQRAVMRAEAPGVGGRSLVGFAARMASTRAVSQRDFAARVERFVVEDSRSRTRRQVRRFNALRPRAL